MNNPMHRAQRRKITHVNDVFSAAPDDRMRLVARVDARTHADFKSLAAKQQRTINEVLNQLIEQYVEQEQRKHSE